MFRVRRKTAACSHVIKKGKKGKGLGGKAEFEKQKILLARIRSVKRMKVLLRLKGQRLDREEIRSGGEDPGGKLRSIQGKVVLSKPNWR